MSEMSSRRPQTTVKRCSDASAKPSSPKPAALTKDQQRTRAKLALGVFGLGAAYLLHDAYDNVHRSERQLRETRAELLALRAANARDARSGKEKDFDRQERLHAMAVRERELRREIYEKGQEWYIR